MTPAPAPAVGETMYQLIAELYPVCRSITGDGVRRTLTRLQQEVPLVIREVPSGTPVLDWTIPDEWNIRDAWIKNRRGTRVVDFGESNLHVVSYSLPVQGTFSLAELLPRLHSLPGQPDRIPYRTSYHERTWGFCVSEQQKQQLTEDAYEVCIDATLSPGSLSYGELLIPGRTADEVLLSAHVCHPSLANDNLSGVVLGVMLAKWALGQPRRYSYRLLLAPGTIGAIAWLAANEDLTPRIRHGLVLAGVGDRGPVTYKRSRRGNAPVDLAAAHVLRHAGNAAPPRDFVPYGYDERQYCSPGYDLPVGCFMRTPHDEYPEYHTSGDDLTFVSPEALAESYDLVRRILEILESDAVYLNRQPKGEPHLGRRGLYDRPLPGASLAESRAALLWVLSLSDGSWSLLEIAERSGLPYSAIKGAADALAAADLLLAAGSPG